MPVWLTVAIAGIGKLMGVAADWWAGRQQEQHDAGVKSQQQTADALQGEADAIKENDRINNALDTGGVPIASDPANLDR